MLISLIRAVVLYLALILVVRLMGKRQLGEMEPMEFVVTMLIANLAAVPMQETGTPLHLEYYLLNDSVLGGCAECYGVEILAQTGEAQCYAGIPRITMRGTSIFTLIDQLAYFAVTPDSLNDVIQDWL